MLLQFTVENFLSFDEAEAFSMVATRDKDHLRHVVEGTPPALRGAAIYGANASGKSNLVLAMHFARDLIVRGRRAEQAIGARAFALTDVKSARPSGFHWVFRHAGKVWSYGFDVSARAVKDEYLAARPESGGREKNWFKRTTDAQGKSQVKFGDEMKATTKEPQLLRFLERSLRAEQPLLTHAIENNFEGLMPVWEWFDNVVIVRADSVNYDLLKISRKSSAFLDFASELLKFADTDIDRIVTEQKPLKLEEIDENDFEDIDYFDLESALDSLEPGEMVNFDMGFVPRAVTRDENGQLWLLRFQARHKLANGEFRDFPFEWESEGTQRLLHLATILFAIRELPYIFVIDEIDRRLHTLLVREFVRIGLRTGVGQLIFTTHDSNLLDAAQLRRDEIHFVQKDEGRSHLSRLSDWKVRKDLDYEKAYLLGMFEGRPHFGYAPSLQGLDAPDEAVPPTSEELEAQLQGVA